MLQLLVFVHSSFPMHPGIPLVSKPEYLVILHLPHTHMPTAVLWHINRHTSAADPAHSHRPIASDNPLGEISL